MKNPTWQRDELILALDLYFRVDYNKLNKRYSEVIELSRILNRLPIFAKEQRTGTFRNPEGVYMKLGNFLAIDPNDSRSGLPGYGKLDEIIFYEFLTQKEELYNIAGIIKESIENAKTYQKIEYLNLIEEKEDTFIREGKIIYKLHKLRERDPSIIKKKKLQALKKLGQLECEVCKFNYEKIYGTLGGGFIECHHISPLSHVREESITRMNDLALVCSNCHRMLHRNLKLSIDELKKIINRDS